MTSDDGGDGDDNADFDLSLSLVSIIYVYYSVVLSDNILHYFVKKNKNILTNAKEKNPKSNLIISDRLSFYSSLPWTRTLFGIFLQKAVFYRTL